MLENKPNPGKKRRFFSKKKLAGRQKSRHNKNIGVFFFRVCVVNNSKNSLKSFGRHIGCLYLLYTTISFHRRRSPQIQKYAHTHTRTFESGSVSASLTHSTAARLPPPFPSHNRISLRSVKECGLNAFQSLSHFYMRANISRFFHCRCRILRPFAAPVCAFHIFTHVGVVKIIHIHI